MGSSSSTLKKLLVAAVDGDQSLVALPGKLLYELQDVKPYNTTIPVIPAAVTYPKTTAQVAAIVKVAAAAGLKVQARSGGHSYANHSAGGTDGAVVVDLKHFQQFSMDQTTWRAVVGAGTLLGDCTKRMHEAGGRAMAHGTCPQVGIGGHATIGGIGPSSRLWGTALDHIESAEVVLADGSIVRASETSHTDIFWAIRGAGASFGIVTEFVVRTEPEPGETVQFSYAFTTGSYSSMATSFKRWQHFVADPQLTRKFASQCVLTAAGMAITGTYYGSQAEYDEFRLTDTFPGHASAKTIVFRDALGLLGHWAEDTALEVGGGVPNAFYAKTMTFDGASLIPDTVIDSFFTYLDTASKGTPLWLIIFDLAGGAINDVDPAATAYAHRDALFYMQSYAIDIDLGRALKRAAISPTIRAFLDGASATLKAGMPQGPGFGCYPGYVDPKLENPQAEYWRYNLPRLQKIKREVDPDDVFHNPQSVRPEGASRVVTSVKPPSEAKHSMRRKVSNVLHRT